METKSKIRNRWYRATEKPLVANQSTVESAHNPVGEINISEINFTDDLNDESARAVSQKARSSNSLPNGEDRRSRSSSNKEKKPPHRKAKNFRNANNSRGKKTKGDQTHRNEKSKSHKNDSRAGNKKGLQNENSPKKEKSSAVSKFLSKLFGS